MVRRQRPRLLEGGKRLVIAFQLEQGGTAVEGGPETARIALNTGAITGQRVFSPVQSPQRQPSPEPGLVKSWRDPDQPVVVRQRALGVAELQQQVALVKQRQ